MKILIVDDDTVTRAMVKRVAMHVAKRVFEADNGLDGLAILEAEDPDILITDLKMPQMDGFELISILRDNAAFKRLPIICLSSVSERDDITRLAEFGITDYVLKPPRPAELTERLTRIVRTQGQWKNGRQGTGNSGSKATLMLIDPDEASRAELVPVLSTHFEVAEASGGTEALRDFRSRMPQPTVVVMADGLPVLSEERIPDLLRRLVPPAGAPVIVVLRSSSDSPPPDSSHRYNAVIPRSTPPDALLAAILKLTTANAEPAAS